MGTANFAGYSIGAFTAGTAGRLLPRKAVIVLGLGAIGLTLALVGLTDLYPVHLFLRLATGIASGWVSVLASTLILDHAPPTRSGTYLGVINGGAGVGIAISGLLLPPLVGLPEGWRLGWAALAALSLLVGAGFVFAVHDRRHPSPSSTEPARHEKGLQRQALRRVAGNRVLLATLVCYGLFGLGYTAVTTFFVAFLREDQGLGEQTATLAWTVAGLSATIGSLLFGRLRDSLGSRRSLILTHLVIGASIAVLTAFPVAPLAVTGGLLFGASFVGLVTIVIVFAREASPPQDAPYVIGAAIIFLSIGQATGPAMAGIVAELTGSLAASFWLAAVACAIGAPVALGLQRRRGPG
jgi:predicted MFS family arabinose efflux permease